MFVFILVIFFIDFDVLWDLECLSWELGGRVDCLFRGLGGVV